MTLTRNLIKANTSRVATADRLPHSLRSMSSAPPCLPFIVAKNMSRLVSFILMCTAMVGCTDKFTTEQRASAKEVEGLIHLPGTITMYSLDPRQSDVVGQDDFHGYKILGRKEVTDPNDRSGLLGKLADSIRQNPGEVAACFNPRHGLRYKEDNMQVDFLICFECMSGRAYGTNDGSFLLTRTGNEEFNAFLVKHGMQRGPE